MIHIPMRPPAPFGIHRASTATGNRELCSGRVLTRFRWNMSRVVGTISREMITLAGHASIYQASVAVPSELPSPRIMSVTTTCIPASGTNVNKAELPGNAFVLPPTLQLQALLTIIRNEKTAR